jgi:hypothetical protein
MGLHRECWEVQGFSAEPAAEDNMGETWQTMAMMVYVPGSMTHSLRHGFVSDPPRHQC